MPMEPTRNRSSLGGISAADDFPGSRTDGKETDPARPDAIPERKSLRVVPVMLVSISPPRTAALLLCTLAAPGALRLEQRANHLPASVHFFDIRLHPEEILHEINSQPVPGLIGFI